MSGWGRYRKKPVVIEAMRLVGTTAEFLAVYQWIEANTLGSFEPMAVIEGRVPYPASGVEEDVEPEQQEQASQEPEQEREAPRRGSAP